MYDTWTVARHPDGEWSFGGRPDSEEYLKCELFFVHAKDYLEAIGMANAERQARHERQ